jgi:hypothetical protein
MKIQKMTIMKIHFMDFLGSSHFMPSYDRCLVALLFELLLVFFFFWWMKTSLIKINQNRKKSCLRKNYNS